MREMLAQRLPGQTERVRYLSRVAGAGGLGLPRYIAIGTCDGGQVAREAKARVPGALAWAGLSGADADDYREVVGRAVRSQDPCLWVGERWIVRRLAPHCERIELAEVKGAQNLARVFEAMGAEAANIHRGGREKVRRRVREDLRARPGTWLFNAASKMADATRADWQAWRKHGPRR
jgi:hypothetical protein